MTKEEISKAIVECEERLKCLREELNKPECNGKRWKPKMGERFFYITGGGDVLVYTWYGDNDQERMYALGNAFPTRKAAEFEVERRKVIAELSDFAEDDDAVWDGTQLHYQLFCDYGMNHVGCDFNKSSKSGCLYFPSVEAAHAAVEAVGEERVKKYYLGVQE